MVNDIINDLSKHNTAQLAIILGASFIVSVIISDLKIGYIAISLPKTARIIGTLFGLIFLTYGLFQVYSPYNLPGLPSPVVVVATATIVSPPQTPGPPTRPVRETALPATSTPSAMATPIPPVVNPGPPSPQTPGQDTLAWPVAYVFTLLGTIATYLFTTDPTHPSLSATPRLRKYFRDRDDTWYERVDGVLFVFFGSIIGTIAFTPTTPVAALAAGLGWSGALKGLVGTLNVATQQATQKQAPPAQPNQNGA